MAIAGLGIRARMRDKTAVLPTGGEVLQGVATGRFDIGVSPSSEILPVPGVAFVGSLPAPDELRTPYAIVVLGGSEAGRRLMRHLDIAVAHARFEASGVRGALTIVGRDACQACTAGATMNKLAKELNN